MKSWSIACRGAFAAALICGGGAWAGEREDFEQGQAAYQRSDFTNAIPALRKAADAGHVEAQVLLARILDAADSDEEAVAYYRRASDAGSIEGAYRLGVMIGAGEGVARDLAQARVLIRRAAEGGFEEAIGAMAQAYVLGELGIDENEQKSAEALVWIRSAADRGFVIALEALERTYREGRFGIPVDLAKADEIRKKILTIRGLTERKSRRRGDK